MKPNALPPSQLTMAAFPTNPVTPDRHPAIDEAPTPPGSVRILLGIDVPQSALTQIEADWSLIATTQRVAPDLVHELVAAALTRLQLHALQVTGVAVAERVANPLGRFARCAA